MRFINVTSTDIVKENERMGRGKQVALDEQGRKQCPTCGEYKTLTEYSPSKTHSYGVASICKTCMITVQSARYSLDYHRKRHLKVTYGLTEEEYNDRLTQQNNVCAVCGNPETRRAGRTVKTIGNKLMLHVDHNHTTGVVRGLLCSSCNQALGLLGDNPNRIRSLLSYLEKHS
jgi:hypothetical protein